MTRTGWIVLSLILLAVIGIASIARVTGVGRGGRPTPTGVTGRPRPPLLVPVAGVARAALVDSWNGPRGDGARLHHAIDIMAPQGTPVSAAAAGRIEKLFTSAEGGLTAYQRVAPDVMLYYAHLERYAPTLVEGQALAAGQPIGTVGATGDADPGAPHLHFEVHRMAPGEQWWQGTAIDPYPLLTGVR